MWTLTITIHDYSIIPLLFSLNKSSLTYGEHVEQTKTKDHDYDLNIKVPTLSIKLTVDDFTSFYALLIVCCKTLVYLDFDLKSVQKLLLKSRTIVNTVYGVYTRGQMFAFL